MIGGHIGSRFLPFTLSQGRISPAMAEQTPQLVIELFAGTEKEPPRITIRSSAEAPTTEVLGEFDVVS